MIKIFIENISWYRYEIEYFFNFVLFLVKKCDFILFLFVDFLYYKRFEINCYLCMFFIY